MKKLKGKKKDLIQEQFEQGQDDCLEERLEEQTEAELRCIEADEDFELNKRMDEDVTKELGEEEFYHFKDSLIEEENGQ